MFLRRIVPDVVHFRGDETRNDHRDGRQNRKNNSSSSFFFLLQRLQRDLEIIQDSDFHSDLHVESRLSGNQLHTLEQNPSWSF